MSKYINSDKLRHLFEVWKEIEEKAGNDKGAYCYNECINAIDKMPAADVIEESAITETFLKAYCRKIAEAVISEIGAGGEREGTE